MNANANQFALHQEVETYRLVINPGANTVHPILGSFPQKGVIPLATVDSVNNPGTISTNSSGGAQDGTHIFGVGTTFTNYYNPGDYITDGSVWRKITRVNSDTLMDIEAKFPTDLTAATPNKGKRQFTSIEARSTGSANAVLQEQAFVSLTQFDNGGAPISYDCTTASSQISFTLHV